MYSNDNKSENIGFETSPLLFRCLSVLLLITEMSAKDLAAAAVEKGILVLVYYLSAVVWYRKRVDYRMHRAL